MRFICFPSEGEERAERRLELEFRLRVFSSVLIASRSMTSTDQLREKNGKEIKGR